MLCHNSLLHRTFSERYSWIIKTLNNTSSFTNVVWLPLCHLQDALLQLLEKAADSHFPSDISHGQYILYLPATFRLLCKNKISGTYCISSGIWIKQKKTNTFAFSNFGTITFPTDNFTAKNSPALSNFLGQITAALIKVADCHVYFPAAWSSNIKSRCHCLHPQGKVVID